MAYASKTQEGDFRRVSVARSICEGGQKKNNVLRITLQSEFDSSRRYIGYTTGLKKRLIMHNSGNSKYTTKFKPWKLISYHAFTDKHKAQEFEHYLKTGSGQAFASKRFW